VLDDGAVNPEATAERRAEGRALRLAEQPPRRTAREVEPTDGPVPRLEDGRWRCRCDFDLGPAERSFKADAVRRVVGGAAHGPLLRLHPDLELREHSCPECGTLLESEVARIGSEDLATMQVSGRASS
jgi:N-methylhydantoinase B